MVAIERGINLKKIFSILLVFAFVFVPFMNTNAFAYSGGILDKKPMQRAQQIFVEGDELTTATDGSLDTVASIGIGTALLWKDLGKDYKITAYQLHTTGNVTTDKHLIKFYDSSKNLINTTTTLNQTGGKQGIIHVNGVRYVSLSLASGTTNIREFDIFGYAPDNVPPGNVSSLNYTSTDTSLTVSWTNPSDDDLRLHKIYLNDTLFNGNVSPSLTSIKIDDLSPDTSYVVKIITSDSSFNDSTGAILSAKTQPDISKVPPANVTDLNESHTDKQVTLKWTNPSDGDLTGFKIYRDSSLIANTGVVTSYIDNDVSPDTTYSYKVVSVKNDSLDSSGAIITVKTNSEQDLIPPEVPSGLKINSLSEGLYLNWNRNNESDLDGYNIYINGVKFNTSLVRGNNFTVSGLENEKNYEIQITAVDVSGNESEKSIKKVGMPSSHAMPSKMQMSYSLGDVANGITSWFDSLWLILAFAIGIPLSFYVSSRIKLLFLS